jgi:hypothetical protein
MSDRFPAGIASEGEEDSKGRTPQTGPSVSTQDLIRFLEQLEAKLDRTVQDFADGTINRAQFENLYRHYQNQRLRVQGHLQQRERDPNWLADLKPGESVLIRRQYAARVVAYSIYDNKSSLPLHTVGDFPLESELVTGFLSGFRSAPREILGAEAQKAITEDGKVLIYIPGQYTTLIVLYSAEPAEVDIHSLHKAHQHFETLNSRVLQTRPINANALLFVHDLYMRVGQQDKKGGL